LRKLEAFKPDLLVLDVMLPGMSGFDICKKVTSQMHIPVILLTAKSNLEDKITGLELGADDYITKPFKVQLLLKRVEALLRRCGALAKEISFCGLTIRPEEFKVLYQGGDLFLTHREFEILLLLVQNRGRTLSHETILTRIWGYDFDGDGSIVHTHIKNLRAKLPVNIIRNVRGVGYRIEEGQCDKPDSE